MRMASPALRCTVLTRPARKPRVPWADGVGVGIGGLVADGAAGGGGGGARAVGEVGRLVGCGVVLPDGVRSGEGLLRDRFVLVGKGGLAVRDAARPALRDEIGVG